MKVEKKVEKRGFKSVTAILAGIFLAIFLMIVGAWINDALSRVTAAGFENIMVQIIVITSFTLLCGYSLGMAIEGGKNVQYFLAGFFLTFLIVVLSGLEVELGKFAMITGTMAIALAIHSGVAMRPEYIRNIVQWRNVFKWGCRDIPSFILVIYSIVGYLLPVLAEFYSTV